MNMDDFIDSSLEEYSRLLNESKKHLTNQAMATYLNLSDLLGGKEKRFVEKHIEMCSECKARLTHIKDEDIEIDKLSELEEKQIEPEKTVRSYSIPGRIKYSIAAGIFLGLLLTVYFLFLSKTAFVTEKTTIVADADSLKNVAGEDTTSTPQIVYSDKEKPEEKYLSAEEESFVANDILENFINRNIRSEKSIVIVTPEIDANVSSTIKFEWKKINFAGQLTLTVVDNKNNPVYEMSVAGSTLTIAKKLTPGLYYWKLTSSEKLEAAGKFFVNKNLKSEN